MNCSFAAVLTISFAWAPPLLSQGERFSIDAALHTTDRPYVQAAGEASINVKPDEALISVGVVTQAPTAAAVAAQNAKQTDAVLAELRKLVGGADHLRTTSYSVRPVYEVPKPGIPAVIVGYSATNVVEVTMGDLSQVGKIIDAATQSGGNRIQNLEFRLRDMQPVHSQVLRDAAARAKLNADAIANGLGVHVLRVISAAENLPQGEVAAYKKAAPPPAIGAAPPTPVEIGTIEVEASVTLRVEVGP